MKLWTSISATGDERRWALLSRYLAEQGAANEFVSWGGSLDQFDDLNQLNRFDHVRLSTRIGPQVIKGLKVQSSWTTLLGVVDGMAKQEHGWWPLCALYEAFCRIIVELADQVDKRGTVFVAGAGAAARTAIAAFFKAGFQSFAVSTTSEEEGRNMMAEVRRRFFGMNIEYVPVQKIVTLPAETSVLVNCTPVLEQNNLLVELSYLNFLKRSGWVFDLSREEKQSLLITEAQDAEVGAISGDVIAAHCDVLWAKWAFQAELDLAAYQKDLTAR